MYLVHNGSFAEGGIVVDEQEIALRNKLEGLKERHRNLDEAIAKLYETATAQVDELQLRRLKKDKLMLRDQISMIEDMLYPDIIA